MYVKIKIILLIISSLILYKNSYAQDISEIFEQNNNNILLTKNEKKAISIIKEWQNGNKISPVTRGNNGEIELIFGLSQPQILTAILQVTDIQFEQGESIISVHIGDTARWVVEHIKTTTQDHLIIKPKDIKLLTSLIVVTDKRTYHMQLKSNTKLYYPMVKFHYPESLIIKQNTNKVRKTALSMNDIVTGSYLKDLDFQYKIKGNAKFKPVRIYNNGSKTIIELPKDIKNSNVPVLMTLEPESKKPVIVNYRYDNNKFIVDTVFDKAILLSGVGIKQKKVIIIRGK